MLAPELPGTLAPAPEEQAQPRAVCTLQHALSPGQKGQVIKTQSEGYTLKFLSGA